MSKIKRIKFKISGQLGVSSQACLLHSCEVVYPNAGGYFPKKGA